jgi:DNA modification methylase
VKELPTPYYQSENVTLYCGDNAQILPTLPSGSVDLVVTSPPYDTLRTYDSCGGWNFHNVSKWLTRVIKDGGVIVWVVADQTIDGSETGTSMRHALHFMDSCGLNLHDTMIYEKAGFSFPDHTRCHQVWEYMFVFTKGKVGTFHQILDRRVVTAGNPIGGDYKRNGAGESVMRDGSDRRGVRRPFGGRTNIWRFAAGGGLSAPNGSTAFNHPAIFPEALASDHIRSWSNEGDLVLDPFAGSGTTLAAALKLGRRAIGCEINPAYCAIAARRIKEAEEVGQMFREAKPQQLELLSPNQSGVSGGGGA